MFFKYSFEDNITIIVVYVDDILMIKYDVKEISNLKRRLEIEFDIKVLEKLKYFFVMECARFKK